VNPNGANLYFFSFFHYASWHGVIELKSMSYSVQLDSPIAEERSRIVTQELGESPSAVQLFSYAVCCVAQGVALLMYFGLIVFVPIAISQGLFS
jgi:hypothetical protein